MLTGRRFKIGTDTVAIDNIDGKDVAVTVPAGTVVKIVSGPKRYDDRMIDALWDGRTVTIFVIDVMERGVEVLEAEASRVISSKERLRKSSTA